MTTVTTQSSMPSRKVLLADHAANGRSGIAQRLSEEGFRVVLAQSHSGAIEAVRRHEIAFALVDLKFEDGDGFDIISTIADLHPACRTVVYTSFCNIATTVRAVKMGASDVLPKPMDANCVICHLLERDFRTHNVLSTIKRPDAVRREHINEVYQSSGSNVTRAAERLSMHRRTLQRILKRAPAQGSVVRLSGF